MITSEEVYFEAIKSYIDSFKENKSKFSILFVPTKDTPKLPIEAYTVDGLVFASFDFGAEETWTAEQIEIKDKRFKCVLVYKGVDGWEEYWIDIPVLNIVSITKPEEIENKTVTFKVTKYNKEFKVKVNNSKKHFKFLSGKEI